MPEGIASIISADQLVLNSTLFPLSGDVAVNGLGAFPPKVTIGDTTRDTAQLVSSINLGNFQGGWLHRVLDAGQEPQWVWQSTADTRFRRQITLPPQAQSGNAGLTTGPPAWWTKVYFNYLDSTYCITTKGGTEGEVIAHWNPTVGGSWVGDWTGPGGFDYQCAAVLNFGGAEDIFVGHSGGYTKRIGAGPWTNVSTTGAGGGGAVNANGCPAPVNILAFADTFYAADNAGYMFVCTNVATDAWTRSSLPIPQQDFNSGGPIRAMVMFRDRSGDAAVHCVTRSGLFIYDTAGGIFRPTDLQFPYVSSSIYQRAACVWRGDLYIAAGQTVFRYTGTTVDNIGLDRVDGLPYLFAQPVRYLCDAYNWLIAGTDYSIFAWDGTGWHCLWTAVGSGITNQYIQDLNYVVANAGGTTRLWWSTTDVNNLGAAGATITRYLDMDRTLFNPRTSTVYAYESAGYLITPWFTAGWDELDKLWIEAQVRGQQITGMGQESIDIEYQVGDLLDQSATWILLGTLTEDGPVRFPFPAGGNGEGIVSGSIRMRANLARRSADNTKTPVLLYISLKFQRLLDRLYGYSFVVDVPRQADLAGYRTPEALCNALQLAYETKTLLTASFRRAGQEVGGLPARLVQVSQFNIQTRPSAETGFRASVSLVEVG